MSQEVVKYNISDFVIPDVLDQLNIWSREYPKEADVTVSLIAKLQSYRSGVAKCLNLTSSEYEELKKAILFRTIWRL
jgi:hypothetical protein